ncbi:hypothetical protein ACVWYF_002780 [Hymenobacter sp. UYAg731]
MKNNYNYKWLTLVVLFALHFGANAQQAWRPFRPGLIYGYREAAGTGSTSSLVYTLRVDSAYATAGGDSIYAFNRLLRAAPSNAALRGMVKSHDNLFGALMRWRPGQASYTLEAQAQPNVQTAVSLELFPRAAVGSSWNASNQPLRTATLTSRSWQTISPGVQDTVAVITITAAGASTTVRLSRNHGLLAGPQWLGGATGSQLEQAVLPARFEDSIYSPLQLFDVQPGDEFGYEPFDIGLVTVQCSNYKVLRRIISKRITADSIFISYQEQSRVQEFGYAGYCYAPAQINYSPIAVKQWALARRGYQWQPIVSTLQPAVLRLLTGEYVPSTAGFSANLLVGFPVSISGSGSCTAGPRISYGPYYLQSGAVTPSYQTGLDYAAWQYSFGQGLTTLSEGPGFLGQIYTRKNVNGIIRICGSPLAFASLLPTRAAQAAAIATLHPNPAAEAATLTLAQPARAGYSLRLTDALGRSVWSAPVPAGQSAVAVPLAGQPAGLYLLHLAGPDGATATWKLTHE